MASPSPPIVSTEAPSPEPSSGHRDAAVTSPAAASARAAPSGDAISGNVKHTVTKPYVSTALEPGHGRINKSATYTGDGVYLVRSLKQQSTTRRGKGRSTTHRGSKEDDGSSDNEYEDDDDFGMLSPRSEQLLMAQTTGRMPRSPVAYAPQPHVSRADIAAAPMVPSLQFASLLGSCGRQVLSTKTSSPRAVFGGTSSRRADYEERYVVNALRGHYQPGTQYLPTDSDLRHAPTWVFGDSRDNVQLNEDRLRKETVHLGPGTYLTPRNVTSLGEQALSTARSAARASLNNSSRDQRQMLTTGDKHMDRVFMAQGPLGPGAYTPRDTIDKPGVHQKAPLTYRFGAPTYREAPHPRLQLTPKELWYNGAGGTEHTGPGAYEALEAEAQAVLVGTDARRMPGDADVGGYSAYAGRDLTIPGPGAYSTRPACGPQAESHKPSYPSHAFGTTRRFKKDPPKVPLSFSPVHYLTERRLAQHRATHGSLSPSVRAGKQASTAVGESGDDWSEYSPPITYLFDRTQPAGDGASPSNSTGAGSDGIPDGADGVAIAAAAAGRAPPPAMTALPLSNLGRVLPVLTSSRSGKSSPLASSRSRGFLSHRSSANSSPMSRGSRTSRASSRTRKSTRRRRKKGPTYRAPLGAYTVSLTSDLAKSQSSPAL